jgi:CubicO group peptidase (beta-lactamase class C family)
MLRPLFKINMEVVVGIVVLSAAINGCSLTGAERIDDLVHAHMKSRRIPGVSLAIITNDGVIRSAAYGTAVIQHEVPARVDTVYEIASLTKQFTAVGVLILCDEGKLRLDDSIAEYVEGAPEKWREITIRHLLTHTSGLLPEDEEFASLRGEWRRYMPKSLMLASIMADSISSAPGERFDYASGNYFLAALAIEKASGMSYRKFMRTRIFEPLGMDRTLIHDELKITANEAQGYSIKDGELVNIWRDCVEEVAGGWGIFSCVPDLVRWDQALRDGEVLSDRSYEEMFSRVKLADGTRYRYGLGWRLPERNGIPYQYHNGITGTEILRIPSRGVTVIVLTNLGRSGSVGSTEANAWGLADLVASVMVPEFALETLDLPLSDERLGAYAGRWRFESGDARFFVRDGRLWVNDVGGVDVMLYQGDDTFGFEGDSERLVFERGPDGAVNAARWVAETWQDERGERVSISDR